VTSGPRGVPPSGRASAVGASSKLEEVESMAKKTKKVEDPMKKKIKKGKKEKDNRR
jgi:hypothetical protein